MTELLRELDHIRSEPEVDTGTAVGVTVTTSDPIVTVSPASFSLGGGDPISRTITVTGAATGPDSAMVTVSTPGQTTQTIAIIRPPVPVDLTVTPTSITLDRVSPGNVARFTAALNRDPDSAVLVRVGLSDPSVTFFPASFSLSRATHPPGP